MFPFKCQCTMYARRAFQTISSMTTGKIRRMTAPIPEYSILDIIVHMYICFVIIHPFHLNVCVYIKWYIKRLNCKLLRYFGKQCRPIAIVDALCFFSFAIMRTFGIAFCKGPHKVQRENIVMFDGNHTYVPYIYFGCFRYCITNSRTHPILLYNLCIISKQCLYIRKQNYFSGIY